MDFQRMELQQHQSLKAQIAELLSEVKDHENQMKNARKRQKEYKMTIQSLKAEMDEMTQGKRETEKEKAKLLSQIARLQQTESGTLPPPLSLYEYTLFLSVCP